MATVAVKHLTQRLGRHEVLHEIDLETDSGVTGLIGPNGAGKSTLLRVLATAISPSNGRIQILGLDPRQREPRRQIRRRLGYLPQSFGYYPNFTVIEFVTYFALLREMPSESVRSSAEHTIERVGLTAQARMPMRKLSGGMLRRAGLAQAIVNDPDLLLLDEPTAGLDFEQRDRFIELIKGIGTDRTIIISTHLIDDITALASNVVQLIEGSVSFRGSQAEFQEQRRYEYQTGRSLDALQEMLAGEA